MPKPPGQRRGRGRGASAEPVAAAGTEQATTAGPRRGVLPTGYGELLEVLKERIGAARLRAALAANRELIALYWEVGRAVVARQTAERWGSGVLERLARELQAAFPGVEGFSPRNVWRMRAFYLAYPDPAPPVHTPVLP